MEYRRIICLSNLSMILDPSNETKSRESSNCMWATVDISHLVMIEHWYINYNGHKYLYKEFYATQLYLVEALQWALVLAAKHGHMTVCSTFERLSFTTLSFKPLYLCFNYIPPYHAVPILSLYSLLHYIPYMLQG